MDGEPRLADSHRLLTLKEKFHDKQYRDGYVASHTRTVLAQQMRNFRGRLSQVDFAEQLGKQKTVIARLENPAYGGWSLRTMLEIARKLNVAVFVRFVDFPTFLNYSGNLSDEALRPAPYKEETIATLVEEEKQHARDMELRELFEAPETNQAGQRRDETTRTETTEGGKLQDGVVLTFDAA
jgi:hypothetical protein